MDDPGRAGSGAAMVPGMSLVELLCGLLRPAACLACRAPAAWPCCARCLPPEPAGAGPWRLAADPGVTLWALGPYRDALRTAVLTGKLRGQPAALTELGHRLGAAMAAAGAGADLVTFVAAGRAAGPPRDHAERVAVGVAAALDLPLAGLLAPAGGPDLGRARQQHRAAPTRPPPRARPPPSAPPAPGGSRPPSSPPRPPPSAPLAPATPRTRATAASPGGPTWSIEPAEPSRGAVLPGVLPAHGGRIVWL